MCKCLINSIYTFVERKNISSVHNVTIMDFFVVLQLKRCVHPVKCVYKCVHIQELPFSQCSCVSAADLSVLRQRRKIGVSSCT